MRIDCLMNIYGMANTWYNQIQIFNLKGLKLKRHLKAQVSF